MITASNLHNVFSIKHSEDSLEYIADALNDLFPIYEIDTKQRQAAFIAQCAHESAEFTRLKENLNYSASRLLVVFGNKITPSTASAIAGKPEAIGNHVYANINGNGDVRSGDGFKYRGRGIIQLTGKANYKRIGDIMGLDLVSRPELIEEPYNAIHSACVYWSENDINQAADTGDVMKVTRKINKKLEGLRERQYYYSALMNELC